MFFEDQDDTAVDGGSATTPKDTEETETEEETVV